jgi:hypothetical protein
MSYVEKCIQRKLNILKISFSNILIVVEDFTFKVFSVYIIGLAQIILLINSMKQYRY